SKRPDASASHPKIASPSRTPHPASHPESPRACSRSRSAPPPKRSHPSPTPTSSSTPFSTSTSPCWTRQNHWIPQRPFRCSCAPVRVPPLIARREGQGVRFLPTKSTTPNETSTKQEPPLHWRREGALGVRSERPQRRKQNHLTDRLPTRQQHRQPVDS